MRFGRRIATIYTKELVEILRDRRTLIAMVVVPIALYPLLIIGSVHLLSLQDGVRQVQNIRAAVPRGVARPGGPEQKMLARMILAQARDLFAANADGLSEEEVKSRVQGIDHITILPVADVSRAVSEGKADVGIVYHLEANVREQDRVEFIYDQAELRSESALHRLKEAFDVFVAKTRRDRMQATGTPISVVDPISFELVNVASPKKVGGMVLGSIVPLVLVLMTITGAIYPAIDLTAGERERGTLETLLVCPVPPMELITGKYLVVTTIALLGAALNLASVGATLYFGGFTDMISAGGKTELPLGVLPIILVALVPFALLFSAVMVAVCSYARTFKEAQNYIMPVILAALIPGGIAALPGTEFTGVKMVVPVMNMVLMARELLLGHYDWGAITLVMVSTSLYAGAAVIVASRVFSTESVVFADAASLRSVLVRRLMQPTSWPSVSLALIATAILFPLWMFVQFSIQPSDNESGMTTFLDNAWLMPLFLVALPIVLLSWFKVALPTTFSLARPRPRFVLAACLIGVAAWIPAHEIFVIQSSIVPVPEAIVYSNDRLVEAFAGYPIIVPLMLIAVIPAICEELFFRGFLLSGLGSAYRKWAAIVVAACVFALFHFLLVKFALTATLGVLLGYLCWQSRSIWPAIIAHALHNGSAVLITFWPAYKKTLGIADLEEMDHLPAPLVAAGMVLVVLGVLLPRNSPVGSGERIIGDDGALRSNHFHRAGQ